MLGKCLSHQKILNTLQSLGLSSLDAEVYVYLGKKGPRKASEIVQSLNIPKQQLYTILKDLQSKGIINATLEHPAKFSTEPFEKVLDLFVKARMEEVHQIQGSKNQILTDWLSIKLDEDKDNPSTFKVLEGNNYIYPKLKQMTEEAQTQLSIVLTVPELMRIFQNEVLDELFTKISTSSINLRILTGISSENFKIIGSLFHRRNKNLEIRAPDLGLKLPNSMIIRDEGEVAFIIDSNENHQDKQHNTCLWTNCKTLVQSFNSVFENSWNNAVEIQKKLMEVKTGKPTTKTCVIVEAKAAKDHYDGAIQNAKKKIMIMTSANGLIALKDSLPTLKKLVDKGVLVNVMAPIVNENLDPAQQLMKYLEVKHIPEAYLGATSIDGQHFYQFKKPMSTSDDTNPLEYFKNTFYTDDSEYAGKMDQMLSSIWNNAHPPSLVALKSIIQPILPLNASEDTIFNQHQKDLKKIAGFNYVVEPQKGTITEKHIQDQIAKAVRKRAQNPKKDIVRLYGTQGNAVIYPPKNLNLPNFIIFVSHNNEKSSFGIENSLHIFTQMKIADEESFFSGVFVTDSPQGFRYRKAMQRIRQINEVALLLKKDELNIKIDGKKLVAGWSVPIPLLSPKYVLPPACIIFEGYGETKTYSSKMSGPVNPTLTNDFNLLDAFVTFIHPSSHYYGPGSDGILLKERIMTGYPYKKQLK
jgi:HTH-type transcriptional regulator, sugar sensing transcriptional regulator